MELNERIIAKLNEQHPNRTFQLLAKVDPISFTARIELTVDGKATQFGYYPSLYKEMQTAHQWTTEQLADHFVQGVKGIIFL